MQTSFTPEQLSNPETRDADQILRACVHCGFCTATCPTFVLLGDERDSPRGRIYLIKDMLEKDRPATATDVRHIDRCLSCLACMTTCPSGVNYMHLVDHARVHIERTYRRPFMDRALRTVLARVLPYPRRFRVALTLAGVARPFAALLLAPKPPRPTTRPAVRNRVDDENLVLKGVSAPAAVNAARTVAPPAGPLARIGAMLLLAPARMPARSALARPMTVAAVGPRRARVALLTGCAQSVLAPSINEAAIRLLTRAGVEVVLPEDGCCGALVHHMGQEHAAIAAARHNISVWEREMAAGLDAVVITASGCGTTIKDYGHMLRTDPDWADRAAKVSALAKDIVEVLMPLPLGAPVRSTDAVVAYHAACSMQHGQRIRREPKALLAAAGFAVRDVPEGHLCCGSAGTYNIMQPGIAARLRERKLANIATTAADIVATGNIGCITQLNGERPVVHTVELLDWAYGGPAPVAAAAALERASVRLQAS